MNFRTDKCNHGEKGRCINCLTQQLKAQKKALLEEGGYENQKCVHPKNMKCLKCMSQSGIKPDIKGCNHSSFERCSNCKRQQYYQTFQYYLQTLAQHCKHKKPCKKCVPPQVRKTFGIDLDCKNHLPYPQALCDACMAPTVSIQKQPYCHVSKVIIRTTSVHRIIDANLFGILLGTQKDGIVYVEDIFFPQEQELKGNFLSPEVLFKYGDIFSFLGYSQVGLIYSSSEITAFSLMLSSMFQQHCLTIEKHGIQISKFITMRLHCKISIILGNQQDPYFQCFMISDQFQVFHRNNLTFQKNNNKDYFDLITAKANKNDKDKSLPTFLRAGVQTQEIYFKEIIVWIETISEQNFFQESSNLMYPFFKLDQQKVENMQAFNLIETIDPIDKYRNVQFLLHMFKLFGRQKTLLFLSSFIYDGAQIFINENLKEIKRREEFEMKIRNNPNYTGFI